MTVVDFRSSGGFDGSQSHGLSQDYPHADRQQGHVEDWQDEGWQDGGWDGQHYHAHAEALAESPSLLGRLTRLTHYVGALVSVGLIVILAVWGYKLVVRDVSGVPVIRAIEGEARTAPDNPGGELTDRTGLAVNSVAAGAESAAVERVAIAPSATPLEGQDVAMGELGATAQEPSHPVEMPLMEETARVIARPDGETLAEPDPAAESVANAVISDAPAADAPVNEAVTDLAGNETRDIAITTALAEAGVAPTPGGIAQSARPAPRPRRVAAASASSAPAPVAAPAAAAESRPAAAPEPAAPAPAQVASGAPLVQIGAFDSDALARGEWNRVSGKFGALFAGKGMVVQEHKANGRTFWRLRAAGFASRDEARRFCAALIAEGVDCIPAAAK
ncbi:SPOR domain-containing protein [Paracoccus sp. SSJ]|uniref:SPOR domain-containing protein n=1 Tax=Paracoccus sp. SSJ TaxID=3050636 RepID=UPI00254AB2C9|nr:SPOR domain-containing protein [Paracoccus sp. SSJ]MDK8871599.1 SPOR domain-containing protein [Paracoccus sp. SSJ]